MVLKYEIKVTQNDFNLNMIYMINFDGMKEIISFYDFGAYNHRFLIICFFDCFDSVFV